MIEAVDSGDDLATAESWSVAQIDARITTLVDQAMTFFTLDGGDACG